MIPGEYLFDGEAIEVNKDRQICTMQVNNTGDRPVQIGSHFHFFEVNRALVFDRWAAYGMRLDVPAGTAVRFEPGEIKTVQLVAMSGSREVYGGSGLVMGVLDDSKTRRRSLAKLKAAGFGDIERPESETDTKPKRQKKKEKRKKK